MNQNTHGAAFNSPPLQTPLINSWTLTEEFSRLHRISNYSENRMNNHYKLFAVSSIFVTATSLTCANDVKQCITITDDKARLQCYDSIFLTSETAKKNEKPSLNELPLPHQAADKPEPNKPPAEQANKDWFGMEHKAVSSTPDSLESRAVGSFKRWEKKMKIKLENGQIWEVKSSNSMYYKIDNPKVTIEKGALGAFYMGIEGINRRLKVKRIK